ncbi:MAG: FlgO family outer membrane protein, partial [Aeromonas veronii]
MNKLITALALALALTGCGSDPINRDQGDPRQAAQGMELNWLVARMTDQLMERKSLTTLTEPIAVASFVDLDTLQDTNWMGQQIEESFIYELNRRGEVVVDFKLTGSIKVTPQGDFVLSRNYKELSSRLPISRILVGTFSR